MIQHKSVSTGHPDFTKLVEKLDAYLAVTDGEEHDFYHQYNGLSGLDYAVVFYDNDTPVGCGAFKNHGDKSVEVKRMYVLPEARRKGIAGEILAALEKEARRRGKESCILETGKRQKEAVRFYRKCGYKVIPNYGQYIGMDNSICFEKRM